MVGFEFTLVRVGYERNGKSRSFVFRRRMTTKMQMQKQIPFGDDNQKNNRKGKDNSNDISSRKRQRQKQMRGFFAALRITSFGRGMTGFGG
jgi:hypothetical protein